MIDKTFGEKLENFTYNDRKGAYLICLQKNETAVVKTPRGYFLIGGGLCNYETHKDCIKRETIEEVGFTSEIDSYLCSAEEYCVHEEFGFFHPIQYYYSGKLLDKVVEAKDKDHILEWINLDDIEKKLNLKSQIWALKTLIKKRYT